MEPVAPKDKSYRAVGFIKLQIKRSRFDEDLLVQMQQKEAGKWCSMTPFASLSGAMLFLAAEEEQRFSIKQLSETNSYEQFHKKIP